MVKFLIKISETVYDVSNPHRMVVNPSIMLYVTNNNNNTQENVEEKSSYSYNYQSTIPSNETLYSKYN
jgi:hypothetical protein